MANPTGVQTLRFFQVEKKEALIDLRITVRSHIIHLYLDDRRCFY